MLQNTIINFCKYCLNFLRQQHQIPPIFAMIEKNHDIKSPRENKLSQKLTTRDLIRGHKPFLIFLTYLYICSVCSHLVFLKA